MCTDRLRVWVWVADLTTSLDFRVHLTGKGRPRLNIEENLASICRQSQSPRGSTWVYLSGPDPFIDSGEEACKANPGVEWYSAG